MYTIYQAHTFLFLCTTMFIYFFTLLVQLQLTEQLTCVQTIDCRVQTFMMCTCMMSTFKVLAAGDFNLHT